MPSVRSTRSLQKETRNYSTRGLEKKKRWDTAMARSLTPPTSRSDSAPTRRHATWCPRVTEPSLSTTPRTSNFFLCTTEHTPPRSHRPFPRERELRLSQEQRLSASRSPTPRPRSRLSHRVLVIVRETVTVVNNGMSMAWLPEDYSICRHQKMAQAVSNESCAFRSCGSVALEKWYQKFTNHPADHVYFLHNFLHAPDFHICCDHYFQQLLVRAVAVA